jgi:hypothetical protein
MANIKYADPSYTDTNATDDDRVMLRTAAGGDARAPLVQPKGYIDGLKMVWVSGTQIQVSAGSAYVPGPKRIAELAAATTLTPSLAATTWYHLFLTVSGATVGVEAVTTAPAAAYSGTARAKTGDTSRRYIGSFRTDAAGSIRPFVQCGGSGEILFGGFTDFIVSNGLASTSTAVDCSSLVPVTGVSAKCLMGNGNATVNVFYGTPVAGAVTNSNYIGPIPPNNNLSPDIPLSTSQQFLYKYENTATGTGLFVRIVGYKFER